MKTSQYLLYTAVVSSAALDVMGKCADGVFTLAEGITVLRNALAQILPAHSRGDLTGLDIMTAPAQVHAAKFESGDIVIVIPRKITENLKIALDVN